jgi:hypothetical protein
LGKASVAAVAHRRQHRNNSGHHHTTFTHLLILNNLGRAIALAAHIDLALKTQQRYAATLRHE